MEIVIKISISRKRYWCGKENIYIKYYIIIIGSLLIIFRNLWLIKFKY